MFWENARGEETTNEAEFARLMISLDWGSYGMSKVAYDDEGKTWVRYADQN